MNRQDTIDALTTAHPTYTAQATIFYDRLAEILDEDAVFITPAATITGKLGIDSLDLMDLRAMIERDIPTFNADNLTTLFPGFYDSNQDSYTVSQLFTDLVQYQQN